MLSLDNVDKYNDTLVDIQDGKRVDSIDDIIHALSFHTVNTYREFINGWKFKKINHIRMTVRVGINPHTVGTVVSEMLKYWDIDHSVRSGEFTYRVSLPRRFIIEVYHTRSNVITSQPDPLIYHHEDTVTKNVIF